MLSLDGIIYTLQNNGGISVYFHELYKRLLFAGVDAELLLFDDLAAARMGNLFTSVRQCRGRFLERYRDCPVPEMATLFHSSYYRLPANKRLPFITTVHDFTYERFGAGVKRLVHSSQKYNAIEKASAVICVSENTRKDLFHFMPDINAAKVHVVHNGVGNSFYPLNQADHCSTTRSYILYVGSRVYYKNFNSVVESLAALPDLELVCVGGNLFSKEEIVQLETGLHGRYRHEGLISEERLNYLYNHAVCLVYPSSYEGFGIPVLEAMRAGCPVVALNSSSIPEVAGGAAVLLDAAEPELITQAIERLVDTDFRQQIRQKGFQQAHSFSWDTTFDEVMKIYEKVLGYSLPRKAS